ncbi:MAG: 2OG-Fe(II) oxygenase family protein [bacterium]|jgi:isopenicillin N synthase-like dioxygenase|nr:isopenicillin N synthase family oxygenase [Gammaproteobacteria bacterium]HIL84145.1 isopenicillin N synthase family oxygenase [Pseudomonadales bacterium]
MSVFIPTIDFEAYDEQDDAALDDLASQVSDALSRSGFMKVMNLGITSVQIDHTFALSKWFFSLSEEEKSTSAYVSAEENFGYQSLGVEHLDPSKPADLKQTFTLRDLLRHDRSDPRWPTPEFRDQSTNFYKACLEGAYRIQRVLSKALGMDRDFFVQYHQGENVSLRLLYYPSSGIDDIAVGQLGAGAHTDYGMITLLFQKDIGGLEVQDAEGAWHPVAPENDAIVINTGDLMERWTNGKYRSTPHRVQPKLGDVDRYSIAVFVDPDTETPVKVLDSCLKPGEKPGYPEITAGEHIQERIRASHG